MRRRRFLQFAAGASLLAGQMAPLSGATRSSRERRQRAKGNRVVRADVAVVGGGLGGCAAALAALRSGLTVVMTEPTDWIGGQMTQQAVPPDEHRWIETQGCTATYRELRRSIRAYYQAHYPLSEAARVSPRLNPGLGAVSSLCHEPRVALAVIESMLARYVSSGRLHLLLEHEPRSAESLGDRVRSVQAQALRTGHRVDLEATWFLDASEWGDLLLLAGAEWLTGAESRAQTGEPHAALTADPRNQQSFTWCFLIDHLAGENHLIAKPEEYDFWRAYRPQLQPSWPGLLLSLTYTHPQSLAPRTLGFDPEGDTPGVPLNLWRYRRVADRRQFTTGFLRGDLSLINWPQNDYWLGPLIGVSEAERSKHLKRARQLSLSMLYWLQTECPRPGGGQGWPGLRLRGDLLGGPDGLAKHAYVRESRRIRARFTVLEQHIGVEARGGARSGLRAEPFHDSVGVGFYNIDLHPSATGDNYIDIPSLPFQIPLGALVPVRMRNLLPACKNLGVTHITNGCYRLHPVEWNIGEAAGALVAFCHANRTEPHAVLDRPGLLGDFQGALERQGFQLRWPDDLT